MSIINDWLALRITNAVGSMWCAYAFVALALYGMPHDGSVNTWVQWISQTFLQLTLLSVIMVGQGVQGKESEKRINKLLCRIETLEGVILKEVSAICARENIDVEV